ncbi:YciI family protein [Bacillus sp. JJ1532]|uniref:YciI family protein n=1 Tax=Bacillus sp. JJ1532 TaxID=3122958 RepID=UPI002FFE2565
MNYFIALMKTTDPAKDEAIRKEHIDYLNDLIEKGKIIAKGPFTDHTGGLIIFRAESLEEAQQLADNDPAAIEKTREFILKEWKSNLSV